MGDQVMLSAHAREEERGAFWPKEEGEIGLPRAISPLGRGKALGSGLKGLPHF